MAGKVVGLGFEIISNLDSYFLMTVHEMNFDYREVMEDALQILLPWLDWQLDLEALTMLATQLQNMELLH